MGKNSQKLLSLASAALSTPTTSDLVSGNANLNNLLIHKNGFYAFESALHVFPEGPAAFQISGSTWNEDRLWKYSYGEGLADTYCFACDVFGCQYAFRDDRIVKFDPETGECANHSATIEDWAGAILEDYEYETGYPLAHEWQTLHGSIKNGHRLVPIVPFVLGGDFAISNLRSMDATASMILRGKLATKLRDLPDGSSIDFSTDML